MDGGRSGQPLLPHVRMRVRGFPRGSGSQGETPGSCHHFPVLVGMALSAQRRTTQGLQPTRVSIPSLSPKRMGRKRGEGEGALQGERRGDSRHRGEMKEGARGQLLGWNQPTSDFSTFIFYQKHVIRKILRLLCFVLFCLACALSFFF